MSLPYPKWAYDKATHTATVRGHVGVPVYRDGRYWRCTVQVDLGYLWGGRDVTDVQPITAPTEDELVAYQAEQLSQGRVVDNVTATAELR